MITNEHKLGELAHLEPPALRYAFWATRNALANIERLNDTLVTRTKRPHYRWCVEAVADLERSLQTAHRTVPAVEKALATAPGHAMYRWGTRDYACVHGAVVALAERTVELTARAMGPTVVHDRILTEDAPREEWRSFFVRIATAGGLLDVHEEAGPEWDRFADRYRQGAAELTWGENAADTLEEALFVEAYKAAAIMQRGTGAPPVEPPEPPPEGGWTRWSSPSDLAKALDISVGTLRNRVDAGKLRREQRTTKDIRIPLLEIPREKRLRFLP